MTLRKEARDRPCMVRVPGVCTHNPETTVLAHVRLIGVSGLGVKAGDLLGAWACSGCHAEIDGQTHLSGYSRPELRLMHLEGMVRTISQLAKEGKI